MDLNTYYITYWQAERKSKKSQLSNMLYTNFSHQERRLQETLAVGSSRSVGQESSWRESWLVTDSSGLGTDSPVGAPVHRSRPAATLVLLLGSAHAVTVGTWEVADVHI